MDKNISEKIESMKQQFSILLDVFLVLRQKYAMLDPMLFSETVVSQFGQNGRGNGFNIIKNTLFYSCVLDVHNLSKDGDDRTPSIKNFMRDLMDKNLVCALREEFAKPAFYPIKSIGPEELHDLSGFQTRRYEEYLSRFDDILETLLKDWRKFSASSRMNSFKTARNKLIAHTEIVKSDKGLQITDISTLGLKWGDLKISILELQGIVTMLDSIIRNSGFAWEYYDEQLDRISADYWQMS